MLMLLFLAAADPTALEAQSWTARHALADKDYKLARTTADQVRKDAEALLTQRALDDEPHLPIALGAAIEVQAQSAAAQGEGAVARALLQTAIKAYAKTSIVTRLQKNLNLLTLEGKDAPALGVTEELAGPTPTLTKLRGKPVLLFFWAHWCPDCKEQAPLVAAVAKEVPQLQVIAPTQLYGFAQRGEDARPEEELLHIRDVWRDAYASLTVVGAPIDSSNFVHYGASSVPTLVFIDRAGKIALYHPGKMSQAELRATVAKLVR